MGSLDDFVLQHEAQLGAAGVPRSLYSLLWEKLTREVFDAGAHFSVEQFESGTRRVVFGGDAELATGANIFLIDHAWSFNAPDARAQLEGIPGLLDRVAAMTGVSTSEDSDDGDDDAKEEDNDRGEEAAGADNATDDPELGEVDVGGDPSVADDEEGLDPRDDTRTTAGGSTAGDANGDTPTADRVFDALWRLVGSYRLAGDLEPVYFLMDEFGSAIRHSASPSLRVVPFLFAGGDEGPAAFSIAWPTKDIAPGDEVTRDFLAGVPSGPRRHALLACFFALPQEPFVEAYRLFRSEAESLSEDGAAAVRAAPGQAAASAVLPPPRGPAGAWRVYTDVDWVQDHLVRTDFVHVTDPQSADILWCKASLDDTTLAALSAPPSAALNQFPGEECLVFKNLLARTAAACPGTRRWLPETFDLDTQAQAMVGAHFEAGGGAQPPLWIVKPWNLGRSLDTVVTRSLGQVAAASLSGPKICQRYIHDPLLVGGRKFDLRFLLLVESFAPAPKAALWDEFFVRIANHAYTDTSVSLGDFQTHFTSMRQRGFEEQEMSASEFREIINREAGRPTAWAGMMDGVRGLLRELLAAAAPHVAGGRPFPRGRALYGVDVMFTSDRAPKLLEVTFCPGVERPMAADPEFINKVFGALFNGETEGVTSLS